MASERILSKEEILPKYSYSETMLKDGDCLEVVTFVGGG